MRIPKKFKTYYFNKAFQNTYTCLRICKKGYLFYPEGFSSTISNSDFCTEWGCSLSSFCSVHYFKNMQAYKYLSLLNEESI